MGDYDSKEVLKLQTQFNRIVQYINNKKVGYEPKCKICNSKYQNEVETSREGGQTLEEIKEFLEKKGENVSIMSISRHFDRHYPARRRYLKGLNEEKSKAILEGEKTIEEDLKYNPEFKEELEYKYEFYDVDKPIFDDGGNVKTYEKYYKTGRDIYIFDHGYCITASNFCKLVPRLHRLDGNEVTDNLSKKINEINKGEVSDWMNEKKIKLLEDSLKCTNCQAFHHDCIIQGLLKLVLNEQYGMEMEPEEFNNILLSVDFNYGAMDEEFKKYAAEKKIITSDH